MDRIRTQTIPNKGRLLALYHFAYALGMIGLIALVVITMHIVLTRHQQIDAELGSAWLQWLAALGLIMLSAGLNDRWEGQLKYWFYEVPAGLVVEKHIVHYPMKKVIYQVHVKGHTRAGTIEIDTHTLSRSRFEQLNIGDDFSSEE